VSKVDDMDSQKLASVNSLPAFVLRGLPGPFHEALMPLEGEWRVDKELYVAIGSPKQPAISTGMTARRHWVGGGRHLLDITEGSVGGSPYYRLGVLSFSNVDRRYEWVTFDGMNANNMVYRSEPLDEPSRTIITAGTFTDQGLLGEETVGKEIAMRTVIEIEDEDRHVIELYLTPPPGRSEILVERTIYARTTHRAQQENFDDAFTKGALSCSTS
jgi:hypothetical protein